MGYEYEETRSRRTPLRWSLRVAVAAATAILVLQSADAAAMSEDDCQKLSAEELLAAVDNARFFLPLNAFKTADPRNYSAELIRHLPSSVECTDTTG